MLVFRRYRCAWGHTTAVHALRTSGTRGAADGASSRLCIAARKALATIAVKGICTSLWGCTHGHLLVAHRGRCSCGAGVRLLWRKAALTCSHSVLSWSDIIRRRGHGRRRRGRCLSSHGSAARRATGAWSRRSRPVAKIFLRLATEETLQSSHCKASNR